MSRQYRPRGSCLTGISNGRKVAKSSRPPTAPHEYESLKKEYIEMAYVVTENCHKCRFTDCVVVCPVDCFHADEEMVYIDPDECIDCGACVPECPVEAIFPEDEVAEDQKKWIAINAEKAPGLPVITEKEDPYPGADEKKKELGL